MHNCTLCPRNCSADRSAGQKGVCGETDTIRLSRAALHFWEEPCISGENGSGTVFFSGCPLKCVYCQNREISMGDAGKAVSVARLAEIFLELQAQNAENINLVTPTHFVPQITEAVQKAKKNGLRLPIVYNTSGYETEETIESLKDTVDIYLTDFKYISDRLSARYSRAPDYAEIAKKALYKMVEQQPEPLFRDGMLQKGVVVRHLILPGCIIDSKAVLKYLHQTYGDQILLSIMRQFTPYKISAEYAEIDRTVSDFEYESVLQYALRLGIQNAYIQEKEAAKESFIPPFTYEGVCKS